MPCQWRHKGYRSDLKEKKEEKKEEKEEKEGEEKRRQKEEEGPGEKKDLLRHLNRAED